MLELLMAAVMLFGAMVLLPLIYTAAEEVRRYRYYKRRKNCKQSIERIREQEVQDNAHRDRRAS